MSSAFWQVLRTVHIHLSLASFVLLVFFALSGVLLVHAESLGLDLAHADDKRGTIAESAVRTDRLVLVEALRREGAVGAVTDFDDGDDEIRVTFERPSQRCDARVEKSSGEFSLTIESRGLWALFLDLHTGKGGGLWWIAIDLAGVLWGLVALTGLVLWLQLKKRRRVGLFWLVVGLVASIALFAVLAPT
ncbi:MAG: PepSY-associated TM helix domain-containing protein [Planctomycetota bacterium]